MVFVFKDAIRSKRGTLPSSKKNPETKTQKTNQPSKKNLQKQNQNTNQPTPTAKKALKQ